MSINNIMIAQQKDMQSKEPDNKRKNLKGCVHEKKFQFSH